MAQLALIQFLSDSDGSPSQPIYLPPNSAGQLPVFGGGGRPDHTLPPGAVQLPVFPFDPLHPSNELPAQPAHVWPPQPGMKFVVKYLACVGLILVPDNSLPDSGEVATPK